MRRVERQYSLTQLFLCVASFCMKINTKNDWVGDQRWRGNTWWLSTYPRLPFPHSPLLVSTPPVPLKYDSWLSLPIKTDHSFVHLRFLKFVIDLVKFILKNQWWSTGVVHGAGPWRGPRTRSMGVVHGPGIHVFLFIPNLSCFSSTALCVEMSVGSSMCCMEGLGMFWRKTKILR